MKRNDVNLSLTMKCSPVALINRSECARRNFNRNFQNHIEPGFITRGYHGYSFTFLKHQSPTSAKQPVLSVKNIQLPENANTFNTGCSLEKWSKKMPRLKSGSKNVTNKNNFDVIDRDFDMTFDVNNILDSLEENENQDDSEIPDEDEYEVHSDIEELLRKTHKRKQQDSGEKEKRRKERSTSCKERTEDKSRKKHHRHKLKKTIKFSISKPASPKTEQIIRVDVTSNISVEELRHMENSRNELRPDDYSKGHMKMINGSRKELDGSFNENGVIKFDGEDEEFIIRCSQLALTQKRR